MPGFIQSLPQRSEADLVTHDKINVYSVVTISSQELDVGLNLYLNDIISSAS